VYLAQHFSGRWNLALLLGERSAEKMRLPRSNELVVPEMKIVRYLLSEEHPVGKAKAKYFRALGYSRENAAELKDGLLSVAADGMVVEEIDTPFGTKYVVEGALLTPTGTRAQVRTIWIVETGQSALRFVTAYPRGK
jgi:hypothetical protein